ncbi:hypothetical protein [Microbulbifer sp. CNSA002]|uniref:hypothetical protein n=1 Tax=unclassified Microbulbifer TaxID=2619833 RepID=UPI0039B69FEF
MNKIIITLLLSVIGQDVLACSFSERSGEEKFKDANRVFRAKIVGTQLGTENLEGETFEIVKAKYKLIESYKGRNTKSGYVKELTFSPGNCMLGLLTGMEYIIYLGDTDFVTLPSGSWGYFNPEGTQVLPELEKLRALAKGERSAP